MSNRNRDDREYDERQQAQHDRQQANSQQQGQYGRPRGNEGDDRDMQGNFSSGGYAAQSYGPNRASGPTQGYMGGSAYESGAYGPSQGLRGQESQGYGSQGSQSYAPTSYGAPSMGGGSQGFGPEGYGTSMYEGRSGYESQPFASQGGSGYGQSGGSREFGSQGPYRQYGPQGQDMQGRDIGSSALSGQRLHGGPSPRDSGGRETPRWSGQQWHNPNEDRSHLGSGQFSSQEHLYGQHDQQGLSGQRMRSSLRGLGPKNYTRSDERIREDLNERLTDADDIDARGLTVEVSNGIATLAGTVEQRWMKHRAEDIAESCSGVRDVNNQIRVQSLHSDTLHKDALHKDTSVASQGSMKSGSSLGSGSSMSSTQGASATGSPTTSGSSSVGSPGSSASSGSSSTRPGGSAGAGH